jgi:hypothetical protein
MHPAARNLFEKRFLDFQKLLFGVRYEYISFKMVDHRFSSGDPFAFGLFLRDKRAQGCKKY